LTNDRIQYKILTLLTAKFFLY